jgi:hypothetical protein
MTPMPNPTPRSGSTATLLTRTDSKPYRGIALESDRMDWPGWLIRSTWKFCGITIWTRVYLLSFDLECPKDY